VLTETGVGLPVEGRGLIAQDPELSQAAKIIFPQPGENVMARKIFQEGIRQVERAMKERKAGTLKSGRSGKKVTSRKQAIGHRSFRARAEGKKVPKKAAKKKKTAKKRKAKKVVGLRSSLRGAEATKQSSFPLWQWIASLALA